MKNRTILVVILVSFLVTRYVGAFASVLEYQKISFKENGDRYSITIEYPQVKISTNTPKNIARVNKAIMTFVQNNLMNKLSEIRVEDSLDYDGLFADFWANEYQVEFINNFFSGGIVSIKFERYWHYIGAVHGYSSVRTFNYNPETERIIQLKDLFIDGTDYLSQISEYVIKDLSEQYGKEGYDIKTLDDSIREGAAPKEDNFDNFGLSKENLIIYFDDYEVGPYSLGLREVSIPYLELTGVEPHFVKGEE